MKWFKWSSSYTECIKHSLVTFVLLAIPKVVLAFNFQPEQHEWYAWAPYCQARYVETQVGRASAFKDMVPSSTVSYWKQSIPHDTWLHLHHYCAGVIWLQRAQFGDTTQPTGFVLDKAIQEMNYTMRNIPASSQIANKVAADLATALMEKGEDAQAQRLLSRQIESQPQGEQAYLASALVFHRSGNYSKALVILQQGLANVVNPSAELYYMIGLVSVDLNKFAEAADYASKAYEMGYPLPGLKDRLIRSGHWPENQ